jgi:hypothetical protein
MPPPLPPSPHLPPLPPSVRPISLTNEAWFLEKCWQNVLKGLEGLGLGWGGRSQVFPLRSLLALCPEGSQQPLLSCLPCGSTSFVVTVTMLAEWLVAFFYHL